MKLKQILGILAFPYVTESLGSGFIALAAAATISCCYARSAEII